MSEHNKTNGRTTWRTALLLAALLTLPTMAAGLLPEGQAGVTEAPWTLWATETVSEYSATNAVDVQVDAADVPHLLYYGGGPTGQGGPWHATLDPTGTQWALSLVDDDGAYASLALATDGTPHVAYGAFPGGNFNQPRIIRYAIQQGDGTWQIEDVGAPAGHAPTLHLDAKGYPHIFYEVTDPDANPLAHAWKDETGWHTENITSSLRPWWNADMDPEGGIHVAHSGVNDPLHYHYRDPATGKWTYSQVAGCGDEVAVAGDATGAAHAVCRGPAGGLQYFHRTPTDEWTTEWVDRGEHGLLRYDQRLVGREPDVAVDAKNEPHISYGYYYNFGLPELYPAQLHYATRQNGEWVVETVDHDGQLNGAHSAITLDTQERPHIAYLLMWRSSGCGGLANACYDLRYARPAAALLGAVGE